MINIWAALRQRLSHSLTRTCLHHKGAHKVQRKEDKSKFLLFVARNDLLWAVLLSASEVRAAHKNWAGAFGGCWWGTLWAELGAPGGALRNDPAGGFSDGDQVCPPQQQGVSSPGKAPRNAPSLSSESHKRPCWTVLILHDFLMKEM